MRRPHALLLAASLLLLLAHPAAAQDFFDAGPAGDDFYNPAEFLDGGAAPIPSLDMEVTDEYRPDGYYEPYDFNFTRAQNPDQNPDLQLPPGMTLPPDGAPFDPDAPSPGGYAPDTFAPDAPPTYNEPLQAELEYQTIPPPDSGTAPPEPPPADPPGPAVAPPPADAWAGDTAPVRFVVGRKPARRFMVAAPPLSAAIGRAFAESVPSSAPANWLAMHGEILKIYADLTSAEPSYPEIYEEFDRVNSVLVTFVFSGAFGAKDGLIVKWRDRLFAVVGPLSVKIPYQAPKKPELAAKVSAALGGPVVAVLPDGTHIVRLDTLKETLEAMLAEVEGGRFDRVQTVVETAATHGEALRKLLVPYVNLVRAKVEQRRETADTEHLRRALEILKL